MTPKPKLTLQGVEAVLFALILSLDKRGIIPEAALIEDFGLFVEGVRRHPLLLPQEAADQLEAFHQWMVSRQKPPRS
jgi:hypothetical protein